MIEVNGLAYLYIGNFQLSSGKARHRRIFIDSKPIKDNMPGFFIWQEKPGTYLPADNKRGTLPYSRRKPYMAHNCYSLSPNFDIKSALVRPSARSSDING